MKKLLSNELTEPNITRLLALLAVTPRKLDEYGERFTEEQLAQPLGPGERSITAILAHMLHSEAVNSGFIYLALLRQGSTFYELHAERDFGKLVRYDTHPFNALVEYFRFRRSVLVRVLGSLKGEQWSHRLVETGKKRQESVYWRARGMALHELEHLEDIDSKAVNGWP